MGAGVRAGRPVGTARGGTALDDIVIARAIHVLAVVHWIGGLAMVTAVILPAARRCADPAAGIALFEAVEHRFARQVRWSVLLAGLSGFYMTEGLAAWYRFHEPDFWWMHAMLLLWLLFMAILFVAEPLVLDAWFRRRAAVAPRQVLALVQRAHILLLALAIATIAGTVLGSHGFLY